MGLLDPGILAKTRNLEIIARKVVEGAAGGLHPGRIRGSSQEFAYHREYVPGDELRALDWKVYGRTDRFVVKQYHEDTNLRAIIALDTSNSMSFSWKGRTPKFRFAQVLAAALSYLLFRQRDSTGLALFGGDLHYFIPPRADAFAFSRILESLEKTSPQGDTMLAESLFKIGQRIRRRCLLILISDMLTDQRKMLEALRWFAYRKNEVVIFHILDPAEIDFPFQGDVVFEDMETGATVKFNADSVRSSYTYVVKKFLQSTEQELMSGGIDYFRFLTTSDMSDGLARFLARRQ